MENNNNTSVPKIQYPRTPGDEIAEFSVEYSASNQLSVQDAILRNYAQVNTGSLSLDVRPKYLVTPDDQYAEILVDWNESNRKFKIEANMRAQTMYGLKESDPLFQDKYTSELKSLQLNFGTPRPVRPQEK